MSPQPATLALEDGLVFEGLSFGRQGETPGHSLFGDFVALMRARRERA